MKRQEVQANEVISFRATAKSRIARVVAPPDIKKEIINIVDGVTLPLHLVVKCATAKAKWNIYVNRVISAIAGGLGDSPDCMRVMARIREILQNEGD